MSTHLFPNREDLKSFKVNINLEVMLPVALFLLLLPHGHECVLLATEESVAETGAFAGVVPLKYEIELDIQRPDHYEGNALITFRA